MSAFILQPNVYSTCTEVSLLNLLERVWIREAHFGEGTYYILSGFGNYNGGVRFFSTFKRHIDSGGQVVAFFGGSTSQNMTSKQLVERLLNCSVKVYVINRKRIFHSKCYGTSNSGEKIVVSSGNFTGPGISYNVESCLYLSPDLTKSIRFKWSDLSQSILNQQWEIYAPSLGDMSDPAWSLLYNEYEERLAIDETQNLSMVLILGHADTARVNAAQGASAGKGSQYFWLSKDCFDFFPPLTILNERGYKTTNSCLINLFYSDLNFMAQNSRVTLEAGNNVDFRLGTPAYRYTHIARRGDMAVISRISESNYEIRIFRRESSEFKKLEPYATTFVGHRDKRYGYIPNKKLEELLGISLLSRDQFSALLS